MSKRTSRIVSLTLALALFITPVAVLANDSVATIEGTVFLDENQNGIIDGLEGGIDGVAVDLYAVGESDPLFSETTDEKGKFTFNVQALGDFVIKETDPEFHASTTPNKVMVEFEVEGSVATVNFGDALIADLGSVSGTVFNDENRSRILDEGEPGIKDVTLNLLNGDGFVIATTTTDKDGKYTLPSPTGTFIVEEIDPPEHYSSTPNEVEVTIKNLGDVTEKIDFGDFKPKPGETTPIDFLIMDFFDLLLVDVLDLRNLDGWGYGNIAKAYFLAMLSAEHEVTDIIALRGESMGWGNIMKEVLGRAGLKGYNLGLIVSGREVPNATQKLIEGCANISTPEQVQELYGMGASNGTIKKACKLAQEVDGATFETLVEALELLADHTQKQVREKLQSGATNQLNNANGGNNGNHGPPPCKGKNKYDEGCY
jgi:hypothetical protein